MSEVKYTKGEWSISPTRTTYEIESKDVGRSIASVYREGDGVENFANALLMASAPAMLQTITENQGKLQEALNDSDMEERAFFKILYDIKGSLEHAMQLHQINDNRPKDAHSL